MILTVESGNVNIPTRLDGSIERPMKCLRLSIENVDQFVFSGFINEIITNIEVHLFPGGYDDQKGHHMGQSKGS